jgi:hypothetical protein
MKFGRQMPTWAPPLAILTFVGLLLLGSAALGWITA